MHNKVLPTFKNNSMQYPPEIIKEAEILMEKMFLSNVNNNQHRLCRVRATQIDESGSLKVAVKSAIVALTFSKEEFQKSIGALILGGVFEDDNDLGVNTLQLYVRDLEKQINYLTDKYL